MRLLEHVLQALVRRLAGLEMDVADHLVLHLSGELPKAGAVTSKSSGFNSSMNARGSSSVATRGSETTDYVTSATRFSRLTSGSR